jgi:PKD repeat protein
VGYVGHPYQLDITLWIPSSFAEPTTQLNVVVDQVTGTGIEGIPPGLDYEASSPDFIFHPQEDPFACVRVCGVPLLATTDTMIVHATINGTVGGIGTTRGYDIPIPIKVLPTDSAPTPISLAPDPGCAPLSVQLGPVVEVPGYTTTYTWDLGNGTSSTLATPPNQVYGAGTYPISLTTTHNAPTLTQLNITGVNNAWCGDLDEVNLPFIGCTGQPDLFFTLIDGRLGEYRSSVATNTQNHAWGGLSIPLVNPPYTLRIYDQDGLSDNDLLGTFTIDATIGTVAFSGSGTSGERIATQSTIATITYTDTLVVLPSPNTTLDFNMTAGALCAADMGLPSYTWALDNEVVAGENGPCVLASNGTWTVTAVNALGCASTSSYQVIGLGVDGPSVAAGAIYPVPNNGRFAAPLPAASAEVVVMDAMGRIVYRAIHTSGPGRAEIDLGPVAAGTYTCRVVAPVGSFSRTFVVAPQ